MPSDWVVAVGTPSVENVRLDLVHQVHRAVLAEMAKVDHREIGDVVAKTTQAGLRLAKNVQGRDIGCADGGNARFEETVPRHDLWVQPILHLLRGQLLVLRPIVQDLVAQIAIPTRYRANHNHLGQWRCCSYFRHHIAKQCQCVVVLARRIAAKYQPTQHHIRLIHRYCSQPIIIRLDNRLAIIGIARDGEERWPVTVRHLRYAILRITVITDFQHPW